jgi:hypothetical protein
MQGTHKRVRTHTPRTRITLLSVFAAIAAMFAMAAAVPANAADNTGGLLGRAYGVGLSNVTVLGAPVPGFATPDTGDIATWTSATFTKPCGKTAGLVAAALLCPSVTTSGGETDSVKSDVSVATATVNLGVPSIPAVVVQAVAAHAQATCFGASGSTTIAYLRIGTKVIISKPTNIAPNTTINLGVVKVVLNEQLPYAPAAEGITVNAVHVIVNAAHLATADVVVSSASAGTAFFCGD